VSTAEEVNRKCPIRNKTVQLSTPYTDPESHSACTASRTDGRTDRQTDHIVMPTANG